jgi:heme A synthase
VTSRTRFVSFAWFFVGYLLFVILFGAWVRISGSGNGCGSHWPLCNGEVLPQAPGTKTLIEFTHRLTSGLSGIFAIILVFWSKRVSRKVLQASLVTFLFLLIEALIGAVLVKRELVAGDASLSRAVVIALHLANTMALMACAATVAWWARERPGASPGARIILVAAILMLVLTNMTGAVTALGDTLFPKQPAIDGNLLASISGDLPAGQHFLVRLRIVHPVVALLTASLVGWFLLRQLAGKPGRTRPLFKYGLLAVASQVIIGLLNIVLAAPGWMQLVHLLASQAVWLLFWLATLELWPPAQRVDGP